MKIKDILLEVIAPRHCEICLKHIQPKASRLEFICDSCFDNIPYADEPEAIFNRFIQNFSKDDLSISMAYSLISLKKDDRWLEPIHKLKYKGFERVGFELGKELGKLLLYYNKTDFDALIPVPIHHARRRERGYNQSEAIALGIASVIDITVNTNLIIRQKYTISQTKLNKEERTKNIINAIQPYQLNLNLNGKTYLLIDDVLTTGSTLNTAGNLLLGMGAKRVEVATVICA
jgi:ComF family protein